MTRSRSQQLSKTDSISTPFDGESAKRAIIRVCDGRGFIMETEHRLPQDWQQAMSIRAFKRRIVVTAARCLPKLPRANASSSAHETTYSLLGPLNSSNPAVKAECLLADPVADIAVLGTPDAQTFEDADAFEELANGAVALRIGDLAQDGTGWLLSMESRWTQCKLEIVRNAYGSALWIKDATGGIVDGMSGSPILLDDGSVLGVAVTSGGTQQETHTEGGPQPWLTHCLPGELLQGLTVRNKA